MAKRMQPIIGICFITCLSLHMTRAAAAQTKAVAIKRVASPPSLDDFSAMQPAVGIVKGYTKLEGFIQREPRDGVPSSERTEAYLGYDNTNLYVIYLCWDSEVGRVRGHMTRRENLTDEDSVSLYLDSFYDNQRAYVFTANAAGVQQDGIWTEQGGLDTTFDTVWDSHGKMTDQGFVVLISVPFKSLRFPKTAIRWGILLERTISRKNEDTFWPAVSNRVQGRLTQEGSMQGIVSVSRGRNLQLTPYVLGRSFHALDLTDPNMPKFSNRHFLGTGGLDSKIVLNNSFVLDTTINPDFSQVESDEPQVTINQRFEVFFPEKRPFFLENSDFFQTAFTRNNFFHLTAPLLFTRRIKDPEFGIRLTGKAGSTSVGLLFVDDRSPGETVPSSDPLFGKRVHYTVARIARDVFKDSKVGLIFTDRELSGTFNRVGGIDARFRLPRNWTLMAGGNVSSDFDGDGKYSFGRTTDVRAVEDGEHYHQEFAFYNSTPGYIQRTGFFRRPDIRRFFDFSQYKFRPKKGVIAWWSPIASYFTSFDHNGTRLDQNAFGQIDVQFRGATYFDFYIGTTDDFLRPQDFTTLAKTTKFPQNFRGGDFTTQITKAASVTISYYRQVSINFDPPVGKAPFLANQDSLSSTIGLRPLTALSIDNSYILNRFTNRHGPNSVFNNHILRSKWNYQFTQRLSARLIAQYAAVLANPTQTTIPSTKNLNVDFLITYLVHPGTAVYVGYNSNLENLDPLLRQDPSGEILRTRDHLINDGRQFFVKASYQFRF